jgi:hypothetical protein
MLENFVSTGILGVIGRHLYFCYKAWRYDIFQFVTPLLAGYDKFIG